MHFPEKVDTFSQGVSGEDSHRIFNQIGSEVNSLLEICLHDSLELVSDLEIGAPEVPRKLLPRKHMFVQSPLKNVVILPLEVIYLILSLS